MKHGSLVAWASQTFTCGGGGVDGAPENWGGGVGKGLN